MCVDTKVQILIIGLFLVIGLLLVIGLFLVIGLLLVIGLKRVDYLLLSVSNLDYYHLPTRLRVVNNLIINQLASSSAGKIC